ncbi:MAG: PIN domain-containing protein [Deltaproteobacteria bacterium]|nr:PIN domain-containing protein [Deltaproteobacteria bacterium]
MPYLLDTNVVTQLLKRNPHIVERYRDALERGEQVYLSAVVYYEVKRGLLHVGASKQLHQLDEDFRNVLQWAPVSDAAWDRAASLWAECRRQGKPHDDDGDLLIAAQAHLLGTVVVTRNTRDFMDFQINVENWEN